ncbi:MAG: hypothetical protein A3K68_05070 [Euryarchaeota archaeon RBG_16_68_13]|nr:MAG: hypothetical protein A3K68_05070 [Euryarchaeota archaeon RBG_16_68_13]
MAEISFERGLITRRDRGSLPKGALLSAQGVRYKLGDPFALYTVPQRALLGDTGDAGASKGLALCLFDDGGQNKILSLNGTTLYAADPLVGTFTPLRSGLDSANAHLSVTHRDNRWYIATGLDPLLVLKSDGSVRPAGMLAPDTQPIVTTSAPAIQTLGADVVIPPPSGSAVFTDPSKVGDLDKDTFAYVTSAAPTIPAIQRWTWSTGVAVSRKVSVSWRLAGGMSLFGQRTWGIGGKTGTGYVVQVTWRYSTDAGATWKLLAETREYSQAMPEVEELKFTSEVALTSLVIEATFQYIIGASQASMQVFDIRATEGAAIGAFTPTTGFKYAFMEYNAADDIRSPWGPISALVSGSMAIATMPLPTAPKNAGTTHYVVLRTSDGGSAPAQLGELTTLPITETAFTDDFSARGPTAQPRPIVPFQQIADSSAAEGFIYLPRDHEPPALAFVAHFRGGLVGLSDQFPRALPYSEAGLPESWPETNWFENFPLPENDELVAVVQVGEAMIVGAKGTILVLPDLPRVNVEGVVTFSEARPLLGQPGVVGRKALIAYTHNSESRAAWVSRNGIRDTDALQSRLLTRDLDWSQITAEWTPSTVGLSWDEEHTELKMYYDSSSGRKVLRVHMGEGTVKITGPDPASVVTSVAGDIGGVLRRFGASSVDGKVYREEVGVPEAVSFETDDIYGRSEIQVPWGLLNHSDFGAARTATIVSALRHDQSEIEKVVPHSLKLHRGGKTLFWVNRWGSSYRLRVDYSGAGHGSFQSAELLNVIETGLVGRTA